MTVYCWDSNKDIGSQFEFIMRQILTNYENKLYQVMNQRMKKLDEDEEKLIRKIQPYMEAYVKQKKQEQGFYVQKDALQNQKESHRKKNMRIQSASQANLQNNIFFMENNYVDKVESQFSTKSTTNQQKNMSTRNRKYVFKKYENKLKEKDNSIKFSKHSNTQSDVNNDDQMQIQLYLKRREEEDRVRDELIKNTQLLERQERITQIKEIEKKSEKEAMYLKQLQRQQKEELEQLKRMTRDYFQKLQYLEQQIISKTESEKNSIKSHDTKFSQIPQEQNTHTLLNSKRNDQQKQSNLRKTIRNDAATTIQKNWRCYIAKKKYRNRQIIQTQIQFAVQKRQIKTKAVIDIQKNWKKYISVRKFKKRLLIKHKEELKLSKMQLKNQKAAKIQAQWRGYVARKSYVKYKTHKTIKEKEQLRKQLKNAKVVLIQKNWRGYQVRKKYHHANHKPKQQNQDNIVGNIEIGQSQSLIENISQKEESELLQELKDDPVEENCGVLSLYSSSQREVVQSTPRQFMKKIKRNEVEIEVELKNGKELQLVGPRNRVEYRFGREVVDVDELIERDLYIFCVDEVVSVFERKRVEKAARKLVSIYLLYTYLRRVEVERGEVKGTVEVGRYRRRRSHLRIASGGGSSFVSLRRSYQGVKGDLDGNLSVLGGQLVYGRQFEVRSAGGGKESVVLVEEGRVRVGKEEQPISNGHNLDSALLLEGRLKVYSDQELASARKVARILATPRRKKAVKVRFPVYRKDAISFQEYGFIGVYKKPSPLLYPPALARRQSGPGAEDRRQPNCFHPFAKAQGSSSPSRPPRRWRALLR